MMTGVCSKFRSGDLVHQLEDGPKKNLNAVVLRQMMMPSPDSPDLTYAANIPGSSDRVSVHIPQLLHQERNFTEGSAQGYSSNITPKGTVVDLYRDRMDVFSVCMDRKLWLLFPPTEANISRLNSRAKFSKKLFYLRDSFEKGHYAIVHEGEAIYLPAGYLHATYALEKSLAIGTTWSSAESLEAATCMLVAELFPTLTSQYKSSLILSSIFEV